MRKPFIYRTTTRRFDELGILVVGSVAMPITFLLVGGFLFLVGCGLYDGFTNGGDFGLGAWAAVVVLGPPVVLTALFWLWKGLRWVGRAIAEVNGGRINE